jgi:hypothetical protein
MESIHVDGARKIAAIAAALRALGDDRTIINQMTKQFRKMAPPVRKEIRASAVSTLPKRGGLGAWVAKSGIRVAVTRGTNNAGIRIVVGRNSKGGRTDLSDLDRGSLRHPLWGNKAHWYPEAVKPGFATNVEHGVIFDEFRSQTGQAIDAAVEEVLRGL